MAAEKPVSAIVAASSAQVTVEERPLWQRLGPDSDLHRDILGRLTRRREAGRQHREQRFDDWNQVDEQLRMVIDLRRSAKLADKTEDPTTKEMPFGRAIAMPTSYAMLYVRAMLETQILTARDPQVAPGGPEDVKGARLIEVGLAYDLDQSNHLLNVFQGCFDAERYGTTVWYDSWFEERGIVRERPISRLDPKVAAMLSPWQLALARQPVERYGIRRQFNLVDVLDPFMMLADPRVPIGVHQSGEFFGHDAYRAFLSLWAARREAGGPYFNLDAVRQGAPRTDEATGRQTTGSFDTGAAVDSDSRDPGFLQTSHMGVRLVPRWWKLGESEDPELWWFTWSGGDQGGRDVIVRAHPTAYEHGQFNYGIGQVHPDRHAAWTPGSGELLDGISRMINWSVNAYIMNVMVSLYQMILADPLLVKVHQLKKPGPGRVVEVTPEGHKLIRMGHPIGSFLQQIQVMNVSQGHMGLAESLYGFGQRMMAATDTMQGMLTPDKRTLGEVQAALGQASQRVLMVARLMDAQLLKGLFGRMISNLQQFSDQARWVRVAGDMAKQFGSEHVFLRPEDLWGQYDYRAITATMPGDPARMATTWMGLLKVAGSVPGLMTPGPDGRQLNPRAVVEEIARSMGITYLDQLFIKVVPDEEIAKGVQAGNMLPVDRNVQALMMPGVRRGGPPLGLAG